MDAGWLAESCSTRNGSSGCRLSTRSRPSIPSNYSCKLPYMIIIPRIPHHPSQDKPFANSCRAPKVKEALPYELLRIHTHLWIFYYFITIFADSEIPRHPSHCPWKHLLQRVRKAELVFRSPYPLHIQPFWRLLVRNPSNWRGLTSSISPSSLLSWVQNFGSWVGAT